MLDKLLKEIGATSQAFEKLQLGTGVVGRSATVALGALLVLGVVAYNLKSDTALLIISAAAFSVFLIFFIGSMIYGSKNPSAALLEGAQLVIWQKQELEAKSLPKPPSSQTIPDPKHPLTSMQAIEGPDQ